MTRVAVSDRWRSALAEHRDSRRRRALSEALDDRQDVAFGVLEPGGLRAARDDGAFGAALARHVVVVLEDNTALLQLDDLAVDIVDGPERLASLGGACVVGGVQKSSRATSELVRHAAVVRRLRHEAELLLVEATSPIQIPGGEVGVQGGLSKHGHFSRRQGRSAPWRFDILVDPSAALGFSLRSR